MSWGNGRLMLLTGTVLTLVSASCIPLSHGRVYARKQVAIAVDSTLLVARDASTCRKRLSRASRPGRYVWCAWREPQPVTTSQ